MRIAGNYTFLAKRDELWNALMKPEVAARSIPGCQAIEKLNEYEFESTLKIGLQAVKGIYRVHIRLDDLQPPYRCKVMMDGQGNNSSIIGEGTIQLRGEGSTTIMDYGGEAQIDGVIAHVGQRVLDNIAKTFIHQSLRALAHQIETQRHSPLHRTSPVLSLPSGSAYSYVPMFALLKQQPWLAWVALAFTCGYLLGRARR